MASRLAYALVTDGIKVVLHGETLPHVKSSGPIPASEVNAVTQLVKFLLPFTAMREWKHISSINGEFGLYFFKVEGSLVGTIDHAEEFSLLDIEAVTLIPEALEDAVFGYLRFQYPLTLKVAGQDVEVKAETLWADLAKLKHVTALRRKHERWEDEIGFVTDAWNELKDKYYPDVENPEFHIVGTDAPYVAQTVKGPAGIRVEINEKLFGNMSQLRQAMAHEMVHWILYLEGEDVAAHGETFQMIADEINAQEGENYVTEFADDTSWSK